MLENQESEQSNENYYFNGELSNCQMCQKKEQIGIIYSPCNHSVCFNCVYKLFLSSGFKGLDLEYVKLNCPICNNGEKELSLENFGQNLKFLISSKNEIKFQTEINNKNFENINEGNYCKIHKDKELIKYCKNHRMNLCELCISEIHGREYQDHELIDFQKENYNNKKQNNNINSNENENIIYGIMQKNIEMKDLLKNQNSFLEKLESEKIKFCVEIDKLINDLKSIKENYGKKYFSFQSNIQKIFEIINLTYLNYYMSKDEDKNQISITKNLLDINYVSKKLDFSEINIQLQKSLNEIMFDQNFFKYEFQWSNFEYKKSYEMSTKGENKGEDCVTKILELEDLNQIVAGLIGGQIYIWNLGGKEIEKEINAHKSAIWAMIKLSNNMIASGSSDKTIKIWNTSDFEKPIVLKGHGGTIFCLAELEKYKIISGSEDRTIKIWDILEKRNCIMTILSDSKINCLHILPDPGFIVTGGDDNLIKIWNIYSKHVTDILQGHECTVWSITSLNSDSSIIASGSSDNSIIIWDLNNLRIIFTLEGHENTISSLRMMNNGLLLSSSWDATIKIWNLKTRTCLTNLKGHKNIVWDVIQLSDGNIASCSSDNSIIVWEKK